MDGAGGSAFMLVWFVQPESPAPYRLVGGTPKGVPDRHLHGWRRSPGRSSP